jgi:hypothetical protein
MSNLTVTEVKEIGRLLNLPAELVDKVPIDGLCGKTDEENLGFTYAELDISSLGTKSYILEKIKQHSKDEYVSRIYTMEDHGGVWLSMDWGEGKKHIGQNYTVPSHEYDLYMYSNQGWHWTPYSK